jgi:hypothetical protein
VPKAGAALLALPLLIIGISLVFDGASMLVGGIQIVIQRPMTMRNTFIIGISLLFALSRHVYPEVFALLTPGRTLTDSILSSAVVVCVLLNLVFLIGETPHHGHGIGTRRRQNVFTFRRQVSRASQVMATERTVSCFPWRTTLMTKQEQFCELYKQRHQPTA